MTGKIFFRGVEKSGAFLFEKKGKRKLVNKKRPDASHTTSGTQNRWKKASSLSSHFEKGRAPAGIH